MGIANTLSLSVYERTREIGLLRAVGGVRGQVRSMVRWESVLISLFGTLGGIAVGVFLGWALVKAGSDSGLGRVRSRLLPADRRADRRRDRRDAGGHTTRTAGGQVGRPPGHRHLTRRSERWRAATVALVSATSERYRKVAAGFTERAAEVPDDGWDRPTPCDEWVTRDVVSHVIDSSRRFVGRVGLELPQGPSPEDDPLGAWEAARDGMQALLDDPATATLEFESPMGTSTLDRFVGMFGIGDVLVHTWDLARATGLDERLDPDEVHRLLEVMEPNDAMMRKGTAFGPKVEVSPDADEQTKLLAFTGRTP